MRRRQKGVFGLSTAKIQRSVRFLSIGQNFRRHSPDHFDRFNTVRFQPTTLVDSSGLVLPFCAALFVTPLAAMTTLASQVGDVALVIALAVLLFPFLPFVLASVSLSDSPRT